MNSRTKGKVIERQAAKAILQHIGIEVRRTAQVDGKLSADLIGWPGVHLESKGRHRIAALGFLRQAERDATDGNIPTVLMRENGDTEFVVMVRLSDLPELAWKVVEAKGEA